MRKKTGWLTEHERIGKITWCVGQAVILDDKRANVSLFFDRWNHKTERTRRRRETVKSLDVLSVDLSARCYRVSPIKRGSVIRPGATSMLLNTDVMIYAVYKHRRQHKPQEHFLQRVPTLAEAVKIEKKLFRDPAKATNLQKLIFRFHAIDRRPRI